MVGIRVLAVGLLAALGWTGAASAEGMNFKEGAWRIETVLGAGVHSGSVTRRNDWLISPSVEYEIPATSRTALGLRILPLFVYAQDYDTRRRLFTRRRVDSGDTVVGAGFGLSGRLYQVPEERRGLFGEISVHFLAHGKRFAGNNSAVNFMSGAGVGYKFRSQWHTVLKYDHISNAGLGNRNSGVNVVGLGVGYTF